MTTPSPSPVSAPRAPAAACPRGGGGARPWQALLTGLALTVGLGAQSFAAPAGVPSSLEGRWTMAAERSHFAEGVTGPAPDAVTVVVTRDDAGGLSYQLVERRDGAEVARGAYELRFAGGPSTSTADGASLPVSAGREGGGVVIRAPKVGRAQAVIRLHPDGRDRLVLEHTVSAPGGEIALETIALDRSTQLGAR